MSLFKKKDRSPYRHIGMALVPPVAFTAVPDSPPPTPMKKKKKLIVSPIIPTILGATATTRAIALGTAGDDVQRLKIQYKAAAKGTQFSHDETFAKIIYDHPPAEPTIAPFGDKPGTSKQYSQNADELESVYSVIKQKSNRGRETFRSNLTQRTEMNDSDEDNFILDDSLYTQPRTLQTPVKKRNMPKRSTGKLTQPKLKSISALKTPVASSTPIHREEVVDAQVSYDESAFNHDLEERMKLKDEQTREMIMDLMQDAGSVPMVRGQPTKRYEDNASLFVSEEEKNIIRDVATLLKGRSLSGAEGLLLKQQIQEIVDENETLKETVSRLNLELSRFQEKFGLDPDVEKQESVLDGKESAKWLTDTKYLSPLFSSYEEQLEAKNKIIAEHEEKFVSLSQQIENILKENELLRKTTEQARTVPFVSEEKWNNLKEQNALMMEEIQLQMEQIETMEKKAKEMHVNHVDEVSRLAKRLAMTDAEYKEADSSRKTLKEELADLTQKHGRLKIECDSKIPPREFARAMSQYKEDLEDIKERSLQEMKDAAAQIKDIQQEKSDALKKTTELTSDNKKLHGEIKALKERQSELLKQIEDLQSDLDATEERERECQIHLANAVRVAEQAVTERATFASVAEKEIAASESARNRTMREQWEMGRMQEALKQCKLQLAMHNKEICNRVREVEINHSGQLLQYQRKMKHLKKLLEEKQLALDDLSSNTKQMELELDSVWQAAHSENRMMMDALARSNILRRR